MARIMTALDILVLVLVGGLGVRGVMKGFVAEAMSLVAWVLAIAAVKLFHTAVTAALLDKVGTPSGAAMLAFVLLFGVTFMMVRFVGNRMGAATKSSLLGPFDRILGGGFGAVKGLLMASMLFLMASLVYDTIYGGKALRPEWMTASRSYPLLNATSGALVEFIAERRKNGGASTNPVR
jgi:membrane protein required for colicin V production